MEDDAALARRLQEEEEDNYALTAMTPLSPSKRRLDSHTDEMNLSPKKKTVRPADVQRTADYSAECDMELLSLVDSDAEGDF